MSMPLLTARLRLRWIVEQDAAFLLRLYNEPSFLRYIGDRGVHSLADAVAFVERGPRQSYRQHGFGLYLAERIDDGEPVGICGLIKRDTLDDVDLGFAFVPEHWRRGYAIEAGQATLRHALQDVGLRRVVAITVADNHGSIAVLQRLGFQHERQLTPADADAARLQLYGRTLAAEHFAEAAPD